MASVAISVVVAFFLVASALPAMGKSASLPATVKILSVQAKSYNASSGEIEKNGNLFDPKQAVRNYFLDTGQQSERRQRTIYPMSLGSPIIYVEIEVVVSSDVKSIEDTTVLELQTLSSSEKAPRVQQVSLAMFAVGHPRQILHIPFFLYDESCSKLSLSVRVLSGKQTLDKRSLMIPFACGD